MVRLISGEHLKEIVMLFNFFFFWILFSVLPGMLQRAVTDKNPSNIYKQRTRNSWCNQHVPKVQILLIWDTILMITWRLEGKKREWIAAHMALKRKSWNSLLLKTLSMPSSAGAGNCSYAMNEFGGCFSQSTGIKSSTQTRNTLLQNRTMEAEIIF